MGFRNSLRYSANILKFLDLHLIRFGHFTDWRLDFESGDASLHVIYGVNEAGKSTTLRAVGGLLFGIPETTRDHHVYDMRELRIGARLENRHGERIHVIRRKGRKDTLLGPDGQSVDDTILRPFLGGLSRELFETAFGLSHEALVKGGQDLLEGKGEVGESLFGASLGLRHVHTLRITLQNEAEALFTPTAQKRPLNLAIKQFQEAKKQVNQLALRPREWQVLQDKRRTAETQLSEQEHKHQAVMAELQRLQRLQRVLPVLRIREELLERQRDLEPTRLLPESCTGERTGVQQSLHQIAIREYRILDEQRRCEQELTALRVPELLLAREALLEDLPLRLGAHLKAMHDLPGLEASVAGARAEVLGILQELGRSVPVSEVNRLRVDAATQERVRRLGQESIKLALELERVRKDLANAERDWQELQHQRDQLPPIRDTGLLQRVVKEARRRGDLETQLLTLETEIAGLQARAQRQLAALSLWQGPLEQVAELPLPPIESVERFRSAFEVLANERKLLKRQSEEKRQEGIAIVDQIISLEAQGAVSSETELQVVRAKRDAEWQRVRSHWLEGAPVVDRTPRELANAYERQVREGDTVADRLWHDADRAAQYATLRAKQDRVDEARVHLDAQLEELAQREAELAADWHALWQSAGIKPLPPTEMRSWLGRHERLVAVVEHWQERERLRASVADEINSHRERCSQALLTLEQTPATVRESLTALLQRAEEFSSGLEATENLRRQVWRDLQKVTTELEVQQKALARSAQALAIWREHWGQTMQVLGLDANATSQEAEIVLEGLARLFRKLEKAQSDQLRIDHIRQDAHQFAAQVADLVQTCAPDLHDLKPQTAATELLDRLTKGREDRKDRDNLEKRLKQLRKELDELHRDREAAQATLKQLMAEAAVTSPEELETAEQRSREYRQNNARLKDLEERLLAEGVPLEELLAQARTVDPNRLPAEIITLEETAVMVGKDCSRLREEVWQLKNQLTAMDGSGQAAEAAVVAQEALAEIKNRVETYVKLKLSATLLTREIELYRERHQGPIIKRAGEFFCRMTLGAFTGLSTGFDEGDRLVLLGVRVDDRKVPVEGLSEGSRDQLYLALRLASLERQVERSEPPPLVVDDILINFDDHRARATLALLGELAGKTQVLLFTHHQRLLELVREVVPEERLKIHHLDGSGTLTNVEGWVS
jgi:uncharacterized protein YhaN